MDGLRLSVLFNSFSVISGGWKGEHEGLCAMKRCLASERILPPADLIWRHCDPNVGRAYS